MVTGPETGRDRTGLSDKELVLRVKGGDEAAFEALILRHRRALLRRIERLLPQPIRRKVSVADVLQEAHLVAFRRLAEFEIREDGSVKGWLQRIAENKARAAVQRHLTAEKRAASREVSRSHRRETGAFAGSAPSPSECAMTKEGAERARLAMSQLKEDDRTVLRLAVEEQRPLREVGERMGRTREAAKKLYARALVRFSKAFEALGGRGP